MARTDDVSATSMPKAFIAVLLILLAARVVTGVIAVAAPTKPDPAPRITWIDSANDKWLPDNNKKMRIYLFYAKWSDACKRMDDQALSNNQIREMLDEKFQPVRIVDVSHEQGKNPTWITDMEKKYRVFALPTLVVVDEKGEPVSSLIGSCSSLTTYRFLSRVIHKHQPVVAQDPSISTDRKAE